MPRGLQTHPRARLVVAQSLPQLQRLVPGFRARIAVVAPAMVVAQLLERSCTLLIAESQLESRLMEFQPTFSCVAAAGSGAGSDERREGAISHVFARLGVVRPCEVRALAEEG